MTELTLPVPEGSIHRSDLVARGWTATMINKYAGEPRLIELPEGTRNISNKVYDINTVETAEKEVPEVRKTLLALSLIVPRPTGVEYDRSNTISRTALLARGWTDTYIKKYLSYPDYVEDFAGQPQHFYSREAVTEAEERDPKLSEKVAKQKEAKAEAKVQKEAEITAQQADGKVMWRRVNGEWLIQGVGLEEGQEVKVERQDHSSQIRVVGTIVSRNGDVVTARAAYPRDAHRDTSRHAERPTTPTQPRIHVYNVDGYQVSQAVRYGDGWAVVTDVRTFRIDEETASMYGSCFLGHEGGRGYIGVCRPATEKETLEAEEEVLEAEEAERIQAALCQKHKSLQNRVEQIARRIRDEGDSPDPSGPSVLIGGQKIFDTQDIHGGGEWFEITDTHIWHVRNNGMDGDNWSQNNVRTGGAGAIGWRIPLDHTTVDELQSLADELAALELQLR